MIRWRILVVMGLLVFPFTVYIAVGGWALWQQGWLTWLWLPIPVCWGLALLLLRWWKKHFSPREAKTETPLHWTPRDQAAWKLVEKRSQSLADAPPENFTKVQFYVDTALEMSLEIARIYHPKAEDPISQLTIPEILAALELVFEDLSELVEGYVPAGHLLTVNHYRKLANIPKWSKTLSKFYWPISAVFAPQTVVARYAASKVVVSPVTKDIQSNVLAWFTMTFIQRIGYYAIELNSGRLAGGAKKFRETMKKMSPQELESRRTGAPAPAAEPVPNTASATTSEQTPPSEDNERTEVTIALIGQAKAGKSSLINAILGDQIAPSDVLPATSEVQRYRLDWEETNDHLVLLDTVGYATDGLTKKQIQETQEALQSADLVLFVMNANSPAREPDREMLATLNEWFQTRQELKPIPVLGVLTHIDLLSPSMEWSPPYDWQVGKRAKEQSIREAIEYNTQELGDSLAGIVPVCADVARSRVYGVEEFLLPAITPLLDNARACAVLRSLHQDMNQDRVQRVAKQFWNAGKTLIQASLPTLEQWLKRGKK